ncbi:MAG: DUF4364 family protein [Candidatus Improbicoccus devescovinae]|nr:MAG: DUF4364 family protein [Candidatus Improbicoccus devescovinae]
MKKNIFDSDFFIFNFYSEEQIKIIICYIFTKINVLINKDFVFFILETNEIANYFEINNIILELLSKKYLESDDKKEKCKITPKGEDISKEFENNIPKSLREKILKGINIYLDFFVNKDENIVKINKINDGYNVNCKISNKKIDLMSVSIYSPDLEQSLKIKKKFIKNIDKIYENILSNLL